MAKKKKKKKPAKHKVTLKVGLYPGSFNPWHQGHTDILLKALKVFDKVIVAIGINPDKQQNPEAWLPDPDVFKRSVVRFCNVEESRIEVIYFKGFLYEVANRKKVTAVIRGLRDGKDLEYEKTQQYWNEDLGMVAPTICFICDKSLVHISSSAIRAVSRIGHV